MSLRSKMIRLTYDENQPKKAVELLHQTNPMTASVSDLLFLLRLRKPSRTNQLAYLMLEAKMWVEDNRDNLIKRQKIEKAEAD